MKVTTDDLLDALKQALAKPEHGDASTVADIVAATGQHEKRVRDGLRLVMAEGRLEVVKVFRPAIDGRMAKVAGYRIKGKRK